MIHNYGRLIPEQLAPEKTWYVRYEIQGFEGVREAGPYSKMEVISHRDDITGFEGVYHVEVFEKESL